MAGEDLAADDLGEPPRWRLLAAVFERVVLGGKRLVWDRQVRPLRELGDTLDDWDADDPIGFFERVLEAYAGSKRDAGKTTEVRFFCTDFATWAQRIANNGNAGAGMGLGGVPGGGPQCRELLP